MQLHELEELIQKRHAIGAFSVDVEHHEWTRLYIKWNRYTGVILANIVARCPGSGTLPRLIAELRELGFEQVAVESPHKRLAAWCIRNHVPITGTVYDCDF